MDGDKASRFVSSLVKSIQALCNGYIDFSSSIEVIGHIHLNIDRSVKLDYVLTEEVSKSISEGATVFASHSYHSHPPSTLSSKSASDSSGRHRQKQQSNVSHGEEEDTSNFRSLGSEVHNTSVRLDSHSHKRSSESYTDSGDSISTKHENRQKSGFTQEILERRRRSIQSQPHQSSPAAKRSRQSDYNADIKPQEYEVIEIKEEPDEEPSVFFGNNSAHLAAGQDLQTPDFSNVVMESLDRVGQVEGTNLVGGGDGGQMQQQQPFPVMMHANSGMPASSASSSGPGPSLSDPQDQSFASTSGSEANTAAHAHAHAAADDSSEKGARSVAVTPAAAPIPQGPSHASKQKHYLQRIPKQWVKDLPPSLQGSQASLLLQPCQVCQEEGFGKVTPYFCPVCPGQPAFCSSSHCFTRHHRSMGYSLLTVPLPDLHTKGTPSQAHSFQLRSVKYL